MPNLASLESVVSLGFKAHTFALFALRWHAKRTQMTRGPRSARRGGAGGERCTNDLSRSMRCRDAQAMRGPRSAWRGGAREGRRACVNGRARSRRCRDAQVMRGLRSAWQGGVRIGRRACVNGRVRSMLRAGNARAAQCVAWTMWANCKRCGRAAWGKGVGRCNGTCGAARRGASGRRVLGVRAGA